jgi:hypothetical protein
VLFLYQDGSDKIAQEHWCDRKDIKAKEKTTTRRAKENKALLSGFGMTIAGRQNYVTSVHMGYVPMFRDI